MGKPHRSLPVFIIVLSFLLASGTDAQYKISGQLKNYDSLWVNRISISAIDSLKHLFYASPDMLINKDSMDREGNFTITGNNLPDDDRIYRLELSKYRTGVTLSTGATTNYIFLILNNHSNIKIVCNNFSHSSFNCHIEGSPENATLQKLELNIANARNVFSAPGSQSETGKTFAENRFNSDVRNYCDSCKYPVVALMGLYEIDNLGKDYAEHPDFYKQFLKRIKELSGANSIYVREFENLMNILTGASGKGFMSNPIVYIEGILILLLLGFVLYLKSKLNRAAANINGKPEQDKGVLFETLTRREKEILALLIEDSPNKDIANKLNLEVSTIKTHIGKIYQKLAISNRNEVKVFEQFLKNKNGIDA